MMMKKVILNDVNLHDNFKLIYQEHHFPSPEVFTSYVRVPYRSGDLDLTNAVVNYPVFNNIVGTITVGYMLGQGDFYEMEHNIKSMYLGQSVKVQISHDEYVRKGRVIDIVFEHSFAVLTITFHINMNPYRFKENITQLMYELTSEQTISIHNGDMISTAQITTDYPIQVIIESNSYAYNAGTHTVPKALKKGNNSWRIIPTGETANVVISFQEGVL